VLPELIGVEGAEAPETDPLSGVVIGDATVSASVTLNVKAVVLLTLPPVDVTTMGKLPAGVDPVVLMVSTVEQDGVQEAEDKDAVAPEGRPPVENETG
jgi:hypothetical protein